MSLLGQLYISQYFTQEDKANAERLVEDILQEYIDTITNSTWMDAATKERALAKTSKMVKYIGYHETLRTSAADNYYDELPAFVEANFLEMGLGFQILATDREFKRLHLKKKKKGEKIDEDWTKYSKPATVNAFYNSKDNSIRKLPLVISLDDTFSLTFQSSRLRFCRHRTLTRTVRLT